MVSLSVRACDSVTLGRLYRTRGLGSLSVTRRARPMITYLKQLGIRKYQSGHVRTRVGPRCHNVNRQRPRIPAVLTTGRKSKVEPRIHDNHDRTNADQGSRIIGTRTRRGTAQCLGVASPRLTTHTSGRGSAGPARGGDGAPRRARWRATHRDQIVASSRSRRVGPARGDRASYQQSQRGDRMTAKATSTDPLGRLARKSNATSLV